MMDNYKEKYHVGDKFTIEIKSVNNLNKPYYLINLYDEDDEHEQSPYLLSEEQLDKLEHVDITVNEFWDILKKISMMGEQERKENFGSETMTYLLSYNSPSKLKYKMELYNRRKKEMEIHKNDIVYKKGNPNFYGVVTKIINSIDPTLNDEPNSRVYVLWEDGSISKEYIYFAKNVYYLYKTGRQIDIDKVLNEIGERLGRK